MAKLTDRDSVSGASINDLIHVVVTGDTSQDSAGSSYKAKISDYLGLNLQKTITANYTIANGDNGYTILINNSGSSITITVPAGLRNAISVGFIQQGSGDVTISPSGTTIRTPLVGAFKIKGINNNAYIEQIGTSNSYHLLGNLKV